MEVLGEMLNGLLPPKLAAVIDTAYEYGWEGSHHSFTVRYSHPDAPLARPFFASWDLTKTEGRKPSWRFTGAFASNGQAMNLDDVLAYLKDPAIIWPEPPEEEGAA